MCTTAKTLPDASPTRWDLNSSCSPMQRYQPKPSYPPRSHHSPESNHTAAPQKSAPKLAHTALSGLTSNSFGFFRNPGSLRKQSSTKTCASLGNLSTGTSLGAGSLTIYCNRSRMDIVGPAAGGFGAGLPRAVERNSSGRSESSGVCEGSSSFWNGKRPRASSMRLIPNDQISDRTEYSPP
jgi:hypothetical protein